MVVCNTFLALYGAMLITFSWSLCARWPAPRRPDFGRV